MSLRQYLPHNSGTWKTAAKTQAVVTKNLTTLRFAPQESSVTLREYIAMRVLRSELYPIRALPIDEWIAARARQIIDHFDQFKVYESRIGTGRIASSDRKLGVFQLVIDSQLEIFDITAETTEQSVGPQFRQASSEQPPPSGAGYSSGPTGLATTPSAEPGGDYIMPRRTPAEKVVSEALLNFLRAITLNIPNVGCRWSSPRVPFNTVSFGPNQMIAYTDGYLATDLSRELFAIVDVKPLPRDRQNRPEVLWQEAAEMVAWIMSDPNPRQCPLSERLMISQDRDEIYITLARYPPEYVDYLKGRLTPSRPGSPQPFLTLMEYGPWGIESPSHMRHFAEVIIAFCLRFTDAINHS